jgi:predicted enzyme related to lactoylglutathione lyase
MNPVVHFEIPYEDRERIATFYQQVFGWKTHAYGPEMGDYVVVESGETDENHMLKKPGMINGGLYKKEPATGRQHTSVVLATDNIEVTMKKIKDAGGTVHGEPQMIPGIGLFVSFTDTEGNTNSVLQPTNMDYTKEVVQG